MVNLLPPQQKEKLAYEEYLRLILVLGILFLSFLFSLFLSLLLVRGYVAADVQVQKIILEEEKNIISLNQEMEKEIVESNAFLTDLGSFYEKNLNLTQTLEIINEILPQQTYLTEFGFGFVPKGKEETARIFLSGYCPDRNSLLDFKESLEQLFSEVYFLPECWVKPTEITFNVTFQIDQY